MPNDARWSILSKRRTEAESFTIGTDAAGASIKMTAADFATKIRTVSKSSPWNILFSED